MLHISEIHEFVSEWTDYDGSTVARLHYIDGQGNCYGQEVPPRDFYDHDCPNARWCEDGWLVWVDGETEHSMPCPDCNAGSIADARLEEAAIRDHDDWWEEVN